MSFINVNKVTLEGGNGDIRKDLADVMLLTASLIYDAIQEDRFEDALNQIGLLKSAVKNVKYTIDQKEDELLEEDLRELKTVNLILVEKNSKGEKKETVFDNFMLYAPGKETNKFISNNVDIGDMLNMSRILELKADKRIKENL